jgi:hypothetical protein
MNRRRKTARTAALLLLSALTGVIAAERASQSHPAPNVLSRYVLSPDPDARLLRIEIKTTLKEGMAVLKDYGQLRSIRWIINGKAVEVPAARRQDSVLFGPLPGSGEAAIVYELSLVTDPPPGYRKRLMGGRNFVLSRDGLFLNQVGREREPVEVLWNLPDGWTPALGSPGVLPFFETQGTLWAAGKLSSMVEEKLGGSTFTIAVLDDTSPLDALPSVEAVKAAFRYAWTAIGPLDGRTFGMLILRKGSFGGGTALHHTLAAEESPSIAVHEMLHWWTNYTTPAWFREGVHTYIATKLLQKLGIIGAEEMRAALQGFLREHEQVVKREGRLSTLAESSAAYDRASGGGDMYGLMPLLASKLDREIAAASAIPVATASARAGTTSSASASLETVFNEVCARRLQRFDLLSLIKSLTGYDPGPLFEKYFGAPVLNPAELLK